MTHVFIVNEETFNIHLKYMFAGTGNKQYDLPIQSICNSNIADVIEKTLIGMVADISKVRIGDKVLFYVMGCKKFFGVFEIASCPFYENFSQNQNNYLYYPELNNKNLTFRVKIKPLKVYQNGISEHKALDEIYHIKHPYDMCWSLIYRKLSGNRGCSFLTDKESETLINLISLENNKISVNYDNYAYDKQKQMIISNNVNYTYSGDTTKTLDVFTRLCQVKKSFEVFLQAYITQHFDNDTTLTPLLHKGVKTWIGNEVVCSVGKQRIDIMIIDEFKKRINIRIIELKCDTPSEDIITYQIPWYINWVDQYISPTYKKKVHIIPTILAAKFLKNTIKKTNFISKRNAFNSNIPILTNSKCEPLEFISFDLDRNLKTIKFVLEP